MSQQSKYKLQELPFRQNGASADTRSKISENDTKDSKLEPQTATAQESSTSKPPSNPKQPQIELELEKVIGTTSRGSSSIHVNPVNGDIATLAGAFLSIHSYRESRQTKFLRSRQSRLLQSLTFSRDGTYLAAGESAFRHPGVTIWKISYKQVEMKVALPRQQQQSANQQQSTPQQQEYKIVTYMKPVCYDEVAYVKGHKFGIESLLFSPKNDFLITLGDVNDRGLFVWDWRNERIISQNKLSKPALAMAISDKQDFFVTAGYQHLKYWYLDEETGAPIVKMGAGNKPMLESTQVDLSKTKRQVFVGVTVSQSGLVYVIGADGHVYLFQKSGKLYRWMNIKVKRAFGCTLEDEKLLCACSDGTIRIFNAETLQHMMTMSKPPPLGSRNVKAGGKIKHDTNKNQMMWADAVSISIDKANRRAVVLYSDKMMLVWDLSQVKDKKDIILKSFYSHSGPIHDLKPVPSKSKIGLNSPSPGENRSHVNSRKQISDEPNLTRFATCSSDRTIRFWHFIDPDLPVQERQEITNNLFQNAYSKDLSQVIFVENFSSQEANAAQNKSNNQGAAKATPQHADDPDLQACFEHFKADKLDRQDDGTLICDEEEKTQVGKQLSEMVDSIRCIGMSEDGKYLASGDEVGNVRIHEFNSNTVDDGAPAKFHPSHNLEVISLAFTPPLKRTSTTYDQELLHLDTNESNKNGEEQQLESDPRFLLVSGGRDQSILVYDSQAQFDPIDQIDQIHSSTITSLHFNHNQNTNEEDLGKATTSTATKSVQLLSAGADKNLISKQLNFDMLNENGQNFIDEQPLFSDLHSQQSKDKILSMDIAHQAQFAVTGSEKSLTLWKIPEFSKVWEKRVFSKDSSNQEKKLIKNHAQLRVLIDDLASVVVSSSTTKRVTIYETATQTVLARASPGQITTSMTFSNNFKHLITSSESGLIFIWKLPQFLTKSLVTVRLNALKRKEDLRRIPSVIQEVPEEYLNSAQSTKIKNERQSKINVDRQSILADLNLDKVKEELDNNQKGADQNNSDDDKDPPFNFDDLPERGTDNTDQTNQLGSQKRNETSFEKRRNDELNDVLSQIKKATNFVAEIAANESPRQTTQTAPKNDKIPQQQSQIAEDKEEASTSTNNEQPVKIRLGSVTVAQETEEDDELEPISNPFGRSKNKNQQASSQAAVGSAAPMEPLQNDKNFQQLQQNVKDERGDATNKRRSSRSNSSKEQITHLESESDEEEKELLKAVQQNPIDKRRDTFAQGNSNVGVVQVAVDDESDENQDEEVVATSIRMKQKYVDKAYSRRFANYGDDSDEESEVQKRLRRDLVRRSSEMWHRQSISSNFAKRKSMAPSDISKSSGIPPHHHGAGSSVLAAAQRYNQQIASGNFKQGGHLAAQNQQNVSESAQNQIIQTTLGDEVTDIVDDQRDILVQQPKMGSRDSASGQKAGNFQASFKIQNKQRILSPTKPQDVLLVKDFLEDQANQANNRSNSSTLDLQQDNPNSSTRQKSPPRAQWGKVTSSDNKNGEKDQNELSIKPLMMTSGSNQEPVVGDDETPLDEDSQDNILKANNVGGNSTGKQSQQPFIKKIDTRPSIKDDQNVMLQFGGVKKSSIKQESAVEQNLAVQNPTIIPKLDLQTSQATKQTLDQILQKDSNIDQELKEVTKDIRAKTDQITEESKSVFEDKTSQKKHHSHAADGADSIIIGDEGNSFLESEAKNEELKDQQDFSAQNRKQESQFNESLQEEIDTINASLSRINKMVSQKKTQTDEASNQNKDIGLNFGGRSSNSTSQHIKLHESIEEKLTKSLSMWNSMMQDLNETTTLDVEKLSQSFCAEQSSLRSPGASATATGGQQQSQTHLNMMLLSDRSRHSQISAQTSSLSQVSIKDDARDLLDKYSQMLLEQVVVKMQNQTLRDKK